MTVLRMSVQAGVLIAVITLIRAIAFNKLPKASFLVMWGVALIRSLVPFSIPLWFGFSCITNKLGNQISSECRIPSLDRGLGSLNSAVQQSGIVAWQSLKIPFYPYVAIWLVGMLLFCITIVLWYCNSLQKLSDAIPLDDLGSIREWLFIHDPHRRLRILRSSHIRTPMTTGIIHHRIFLPCSMDTHDDQTVKFVLTHEFIHIRRGDMLWKILALCSVCMHWFNPMIWVMLVYLNRDLEITCDEMVLRHLGCGLEAKKAYAYSLISMAERKSSLSLANSFFNKNDMKERIVAIMKFKKSSVFSIVLSLAIILVLLMGFTTKSEAHNLDSIEANAQETKSAYETSRLFLPLEGVLIKASRADIEQYLNAESDQERETILETLLSNENNTIIPIEKTNPPSQGGTAVADTSG